MPTHIFKLSELFPETFPRFVLPAEGVPITHRDRTVCVADIAESGHVLCELPDALYETVEHGFVVVSPITKVLTENGNHLLKIESLDIARVF